jgi:hypothetical protein
MDSHPDTTGQNGAECADNPQNAPQSRAARSKLSPNSVTNRSRISNGRELLPDIDLRLAIARRYRDLVAQIAIDQGGPDRCSETRMQLIRRFASGAVLAEELEARLVRGEQVDIAEHALLSSTLVRLAQRIGINRVAKDVSPTLGDYLRDPSAIEEAAE